MSLSIARRGAAFCIRRLPLHLATLIAVGAFAVAQQPRFERVGRGNIEADLGAVDMALSLDGEWMAVVSWSNNLSQNVPSAQQHIYLVSTTTMAVQLVTGMADGPSYSPALSSDGEWLAFASDATSLVANDTNGVRDVFLFQRSTGQLTRASVDAGGFQLAVDSDNPDVSDLGDVAFDTAAAIDTSDTNGRRDVYVRWQSPAPGVLATQLISCTTPNLPGRIVGSRASSNPSIAPNSQFVAFESLASNLVPATVTIDQNNALDIYVADLRIPPVAPMILVSQAALSVVGGPTFAANNASVRPDMHYEGIVFSSIATDILPQPSTPGRRHVYYYDVIPVASPPIGLVRISGTGGPTGAEGNGDSDNPVLAEQRVVVFDSAATNLTSGDTNGVRDIYAWSFGSGQMQRATGAVSGAEPNSDCTNPAASGSLGALQRCLFLSGDSALPVPIAETSGWDLDVFLGLQDYPANAIYGSVMTGLYCPMEIELPTAIASVTLPAPFVVHTKHAPTNSSPTQTFLIYSLAGPNDIIEPTSAVFAVSNPVVRVPNPTAFIGPTACDNDGMLDFNAYIQSGVDSRLVPGVRVWLQAFKNGGSGSVSGRHYSNALSFVIQP